MLIGMKIHLTSEQRIALEMLHKNSRDWCVRDRILCVLLAAESWTAAMIAMSQLIDETTVRRHLNDWINEEKLKPEDGGSDSHLSELQTAELHYLPLYSPSLNPITRLWKVMNEQVRNNRYFASAKASRVAINEFFDRTLPAIAGTLTWRINDNVQTLEKASSGSLRIGGCLNEKRF